MTQERSSTGLCNVVSLKCVHRRKIFTICFLGLLKNPEESAQLAGSVPDSDGVYFVPAFSGLQVKPNANLKNYI